jgi:transposase
MDPQAAARRLAALERQGLLNPAASSVRDTLFADNDFFDPSDIVQVRYEMLRAGRVGERSVAETAAAFGVSRATYYQQVAAFAEEGIAGLIPDKRGPRGAHKLTDAVVDFVAGELVQNPALDSRAMAAAVAERFGVQVHPRSVERAMARRGKKNGAPRR